MNFLWDYLKDPSTQAILTFIGTFISITVVFWKICSYFSKRSKKKNELKEIEIYDGKIIVTGSSIVNILNINPYKYEANNLNNVAGNLENLIDNFDHTKTNFGENFDKIKELLGCVAHQKGIVEESNGIYGEADRWFTQAIQFQPNNPHFLNSAGNIKRILGFYNEAEQLFKRAVEILETHE